MFFFCVFVGTDFQSMNCITLLHYIRSPALSGSSFVQSWSLFDQYIPIVMTFRSTFSMASAASTFVLLTTSTAYAARIADFEEVTGQCVTMRVRFTEFLC